MSKEIQQIPAEPNVLTRPQQTKGEADMLKSAISIRPKGMPRQVVFMLIVFACVSGARFGYASPITYTDQVIASGSLGASTFSNVLVTVTFAGDTTNVS